ncbi:MAG TPA: glycosyltransferase family 2 protein [Pyrinomonadaceae bacterium]|nr:glycosyltransferase family 2 protein [Pyrinomonadaceae bacterium]
MPEPHFSLVVLCYRSGKDIIPFVERLQRTLSRCNFSWELVLVGNYIEGSDDETPQVVKKLAESSDNIRTVIRPKQGMMGWDMRMGLDAARGTYIGVIDGDGQFPPESIIACLLKCELEDLDLAKTYRVIRDDGLYRRLISAVYNGIFSLLFGFKVRDVNSKPKIIRRDKYELLHLESDDWFADAEIMIRARELGLKIGETPVHFMSNDTRGSFVKPKAILEFSSNLLRYRFSPKQRTKAASALGHSQYRPR